MKKNLINLIGGIGLTLMVSSFSYTCYSQEKDLGRTYLTLKEKITLSLSGIGQALFIYGLYKHRKQTEEIIERRQK